jgi:hypothetical protein
MSATNTPEGPGGKQDHPKKIVFFIDKQKFETTDPNQTPRSLLTLAGEDPAETTLVLKEKGGELKKYTNLDEPIILEEGMHFVVFHNKPTPVS